MPSYGYTLAHLLAGCLAAFTIYLLFFEHVRRVYEDSETGRVKSNPKRATVGASSPHSPSPNGSDKQESGSPVSLGPLGTPSTTSNRRRLRKLTLELSDEMKRKQLLSKVLTAVFVISSMCRSTVRMCPELSAFRVIPRVHCTAVYRTIAVFYAFMKGSLYAVMVCRIDMSFSRSIYAYKERTIQMLYGLVFVVFLILLIWSPIEMNGDIKRSNYNVNGERVDSDSNQSVIHCYAQPSQALAGFSVIFDVVFMLTMVVMFVRPLRMLFANQIMDTNFGEDRGRLHKSKNKNDLSAADLRGLEMKLLPVKYTVLTLTAVIANWIAICTITSGYAIGLTIENPISVAMVLFMSQLWYKEYWLLFSPVLKSLKTLRLVNEDIQLSITLMSEYFAQMDRTQKIDDRSVAQKVINQPNTIKVTLVVDEND